MRKKLPPIYTEPSEAEKRRVLREILIEIAVLAAIICPIGAFLLRAWGWR